MDQPPGTGQTPIRQEVEEFVAAGPLPSCEAGEEEIDEASRLLERIARPVTDEEAQLLATAFGDDDCYGLAWTLLHLIETAPTTRYAEYEGSNGRMWVDLLNARIDCARELDHQNPAPGGE